jgi:hypothetical protein
MKDLQPFVDKIWESEEDDVKRQYLRDMVNYSSATPKTKKLTLLQIDKAPYFKLDQLAINYSLAGMGMKTI